jgi:phosphoenolpyruvate carboxykinase (ATP)
VDPDALVVEPYANPFRTYPLANDYVKFKKLVEEKNVDCYIINTGDFFGKDVTKQITLGVLEAIVEKKADFKQWGPFEDIEIFEQEGYVPDLSDEDYVKALKARMNDRLEFVQSRNTFKDGYDKLPEDALEAIQKVIDCLA